MSKRVYIFDTTLRDGEQTPGISLNVHEKLEIAMQLERLGVDAIEAGFPIASKGDFECVMAVAKNVRKPVIVGLARTVKGDIDRAWEALKYAEKPRIHTFIATSDIHMEYKLKMTPEEVLERIHESVSYAKSLCPDVEFSAEDASRTRPEFLFEAVETAIKAGATVINIPDTVGYGTPDEFGNLIKSVVDNVEGIEDVILSVHCHNDLGLGVTNSLSAIQNGANQVECTINGLGERAGNAALEEIVMALKTRGNFYGAETAIVTEELYRTSRLVSHLTGVNIQPNKAIIGVNAFAHESGIHQHGMLANRETYEIMTPESVGFRQTEMVLGKHSGRHAFEDKLREMGYDNLKPEKINEAFEKFKDLADKKKEVLDRDIEALIREKFVRIPEVYELDYFHITSGNSTISTATVRLKKEEELIQEAACGDGPIDATFRAIARAADIEVNLKDYSLRAVTSGTDALGEVTVKVAKNGDNFIGRGISTDVIEASAKGYVNAINKMIYETE